MLASLALARTVPSANTRLGGRRKERDAIPGWRQLLAARAALQMWQDFDGGEIGDDFAQMAALGLDTVRVFVRWDAFAPVAKRVEPLMVERLADVLDRAATAGLSVIPALCGYAAGANWLPAWALDPSAPRGAANIYTGPALEAQLGLNRVLGQRFAEHPAIAAWDIGNAFSNVREPSHRKVSAGEHSQAPADEATVAAWSRRTSEALRAGTQTPVTAGTHGGDLTEDRNIRLGSLCAPLAFTSLQATTVSTAFARNRLDPEVLPFLAMLAAGFSFKPVLVSGFGGPTCPPGKFSAFERLALAGEPPNLTIAPSDPVFAPFPCLTDDESAAYCTATLERLHADGRLGALWWSWTDYPDALAAYPPFDAAPHERCCGILRADGSAKPVAAALGAFALQARTVVRAVEMPTIASAYYYRTLPTSTHTLYESFLRFVADRRSAA